MPLPSSGQISFNDVRVEVSQSVTNYSASEWSMGMIDGVKTQSLAPINVLSSGSRFTEANPMKPPISMSQWYGYNHLLAVSSSVTGTLYQHFTGSNTIFGTSSTMLIFNAGTSSMSMSINISGSIPGGSITIFRDRNFYQTSSKTSGTGDIITSSFNLNDINTSYTFYHNADSGSFIYCVLYRNVN